MKLTSIAPVAGLLLASLSQPAFAETLAVVHGRVLTAAGATLEDGTVVVHDGRIVAVGRSVAVPTNARIIDARGDVVTPGFIAADTTLGTVEVSSDGKSNDAHSSTSLLSAGVDVQYALNPDVTTIPVARLGGVTRAIVLPEGDRGSEGEVRLFDGQGAAISLGQGTILTRARVGMVVDLGEAGAERAGGSREASYVLIRAAFDEARRFRAQGDRYTGDFQPLPLSRNDLSALLPVVDGRVALVVGAHRAADILQVIALAKEYRLKLVIRGGEEAWRVALQLAAIGAGVILVPTDNLPKSFETLGSTSESAGRLASAGVGVAIIGNDASYRVREMRFNAGMAIARGLSPDDALKALTINPAKMFGLDDVLGSIEPGKRADLVIWDGDPFEPLSQPRTILIDGVAQSLDSRPRSLGRRYGAAPGQP